MVKKLFVRGFPLSFTSQNLLAKFRPYGKIKKHKVIIKDNRIFGFVTFYNEEHAINAIKGLNNKIEDEILWHVVSNLAKKDLNSRYRRLKRKIENREKTLYLRDFPAGTTEGMLREIFEKYGIIESVCIKDKVAFVAFLNPECAVNAQKNEKLLEIDGLRVYVEMLKPLSDLSNKIEYKKNEKKRRKENLKHFVYSFEDYVENKIMLEND